MSSAKTAHVEPSVEEIKIPAEDPPGPEPLLFSKREYIVDMSNRGMTSSSLTTSDPMDYNSDD